MVLCPAVSSRLCPTHGDAAHPAIKPQIEKVLANIEDDDIDLTMVIEQLWEDLKLAHKQISQTMDRNDFYAKYYKLGDYWYRKFNG